MCVSNITDPQVHHYGVHAYKVVRKHANNVWFSEYDPDARAPQDGETRGSNHTYRPGENVAPSNTPGFYLFLNLVDAYRAAQWSSQTVVLSVYVPSYTDFRFALTETGSPALLAHRIVIEGEMSQAKIDEQLSM